MTFPLTRGLHGFLTDFVRRTLAGRADGVDASGVTDVPVIDETPYGVTLNLDASSWSPRAAHAVWRQLRIAVIETTTHYTDGPMPRGRIITSWEVRPVAKAIMSVVIARPVEDVFRVLTDPTLAPRWAANAIKGELLTDGPVGIGSRRRAVVKGVLGRTMESVMEVTEFERDRALGLRLISASWGGSGRTRYTLTTEGEATRIDWMWEMQPGGLLKPFDRPLMAMFQRLFRRDLENLRAMMESHAL